MTGNRVGLTNEARATFMRFITTIIVDEAHHGDCIGADKEFHDICLARKIPVVVHPPTDNKARANCSGALLVLPTKKYIERNKDIVNNTDILVAFPPTQDEILRSGTWTTIRYAKKVGKPLYIIYPNGDMEVFMK